MTAPFQKLDSQVLIVPTADVLASVTAKLLAKAFSKILQGQQRLTFIPSSGKTPLKTYRLLAQYYQDTVDWSRVTVVQMDEYCAQNLEPNLYFDHFLQTHLLQPLGIENFISMRKSHGNGLYEPEAYSEKLLSLGPIDFALHGIGRNGHIGFNEPGSDENSKTRIVELAQSTRHDNFSDIIASNRPQYGMTIGLGELRRVKHTLLIASGQHKSAALKSLINRDSISDTPACVLWGSSDFGLIVDQHAAKSFI